MLLFLIGFVASVNDSIGYNYLMEYGPGIVSYHNLYFNGRGEYDFEESEEGYTFTSTKIYYYKRYYSLKNDLNFRIAPDARFIRSNSENLLLTYLSVDGDYKIYPTAVPFFTSFEGNFWGNWTKGSGYTNISIGGELKTGIGFGRMVPLSKAYEALKIEEELIE